MERLETADVYGYSNALWAVDHIVLPRRVKWDFARRPWMLAIYDTIPFARARDGGMRRLVVRKPTQIGMSTAALAMALHFANYYPVNVGYYLPRRDDVTDFVSTNADPIIEASPFLKERLADLDSTRIKQFGAGTNASHIYFQESSVIPRMLGLDAIIVDEVDLSNQMHLQMVRDRLDASEWQIDVSLSTPSIPDYGVSLLYEKKSTAHQWLVPCEHCGGKQEITWDDNVRHVDGRTYLGCRYCDAGNDQGLGPEAILKGEWVARYPDRDVVGYTLSQLLCPWIDLNDLWALYHDPHHSLKIFYNFRLGLPYESGSGQLDKELLKEVAFPLDPFPQQIAGDGCFMGIDQGDQVFVVVVRPVGGTRHVIHAERMLLQAAPARLANLVRQFGVVRVVIDALPNKLLAMGLQQAFPKRVFMAYYSDISDSSGIRVDKTQGKVTIDKTALLDRLLLRELPSGQVWFWWGTADPMDPIVEEMFDHICALKRDEQMIAIGTSRETMVGLWRNTGADHFTHCLGYAEIAIDMREAHKRLKVIGGQIKQPEEEETGLVPVAPPLAEAHEIRRKVSGFTKVHLELLVRLLRSDRTHEHILTHFVWPEHRAVDLALRYHEKPCLISVVDEMLRDGNIR